MKEPKVSKDFTVEDIHNIRRWSYHRRLEIGEDAYKKETDEELSKVLLEFPGIKVVRLLDLKKSP